VSHLDTVRDCVKKVFRIFQTRLRLVEDHSNKLLILTNEQVAKFDTHQPGSGDKHNVLALRHESFPREVFQKSLLTTAITLGGFGVTNETKSFGGKREKAALLYIDRLPNDIVTSIVQR
jgi:hypothetical protein